MHIFKILLKLAISTGLITLLVIYSDLSSLRSSFEKIGWQDLLLSSAILLAATPLLSWRWFRIAHAIDLPISLRLASTIVLIGTFFNQLLPSSIGGDAMRFWLLKKEKLSLAKGFSSILLDRVVALTSMTLIVMLGLPILSNIIHAPTLISVVAVISAFSIAGIALLLTLDKISSFMIFRKAPYLSKLSSISVDARKVFLTWSSIVPTLAISSIIHLMVSIAVWVISCGIGLTVTLVEYFLLLPLVLLLSLIPISFAGWGVREGAMVACLGLLGVAPAPAMAVSILFGLSYLITGMPGCAIWLIAREGKHQN